MKQILVLLLLSPMLSFTITTEDMEGTWYRVYSVYKPWADDNQGTVSFYEENLVFNKVNTVYIYRDGKKDPFGKSLYTIIKRDDNDFLIFYSPEQNPKSKKIQDKQGFYVTIKSNTDQVRELHLLSAHEYKQNKKLSTKLPGILYKKIPDADKDTKFLKVPVQN